MRHGKRNFDRTERVGGQIMREMATLLRTGVKDPRCGDVTVTRVEVTRDYSLARIWYTVLDDESKEATAEALESAKGHLRSELAKRLTVFKTPELRFIYDDSVERGMALSSLIEKAASEPPVPPLED